MFEFIFLSFFVAISLGVNTWIAFNNKYYLYYDQCVYHPSNAASICEDLGGRLLIANTQEIRDFVTTTVYDGTSSKGSCAGWRGFFLDGLLNYNTRMVHFSDGTSESFDNILWDNNEPGSSSSQPNFGFSPNSRKFHSVYPHEANAFFCETDTLCMYTSSCI